MSRTCATCIHPEHEAIDKTLLAGQPYRSVARQYEASPPSVYRHQQEHLPAAMVKAVEAAEVAHGGSLLEQLEGLQVKALGILTKAEQAGDLRTALMAVREVRGTLEVVDKITGELVTRPTLRWSPYSTPAKGLYLCSASTPPGGGVHGMCGYHAARACLRRDL